MRETEADLERPSFAPAPVTHGEILRRVRKAIAADLDDGIECIYTEFDKLLREEAFTTVNELLRALDPASLLTVHSLACASITYAARDQLPARASFVARVRSHLTEVDPDRVEELLAGFE